jgi:hypothetical protein
VDGGFQAHKRRCGDDDRSRSIGCHREQIRLLWVPVDCERRLPDGGAGSCVATLRTGVRGIVMVVRPMSVRTGARSFSMFMMVMKVTVSVAMPMGANRVFEMDVRPIAAGMLVDNGRGAWQERGKEP